MLRKFRIPIIVLVTVLLNQAAGYVVHAAMPQALLAQGNTRYAIAQSTSVSGIFPELGWMDFSGMTKWITIPTGQTGDVMMVFCGESNASSGSLLVRVYVGGVLASPPELTLQQDSDVGSQCAIFFKANVGEGDKAVKVQWKTTGSLANMAERSLLVIVNHH